MRKVTKQVVEAFRTHQTARVGNTYTDGRSLFLHGNKIAWYDECHALWIDSCGWNSNTTRERLNGLYGVRVSTKLGQMYLNGKEWNGKAIKL